MHRALGLSAGTFILLAAGLTVPPSAVAAGGPPTITVLNPNPVTADGTVTVSGQGCDAGSPVSFYVWNTSGGSLPITVNNAESGWVASSAGRFTRAIDLDNALALIGTSANEIGVAASCTPTYDWTVANNPVADGSYLTLLPADPTVELGVAARAGYGSRPVVTVRTRRATGVITVELDGAVVHTSTTGSRSGGTSFRLPADLTLGSHSLTTTFDEAPAGVAAVVDSATVTVVKAKPAVKLKTKKKRVQAGRKATLTVVLKAGAAPRTGTVQIREGKKVRKTFQLKPRHNGTRTVKVMLRGKGAHKLKAVFLGSSHLRRAGSPKVTITLV